MKIRRFAKKEFKLNNNLNITLWYHRNEWVMLFGFAHYGDIDSCIEDDEIVEYKNKTIDIGFLCFKIRFNYHCRIVIKENNNAIHCPK